jgi:anti-sigma factor RsiW
MRCAKVGRALPLFVGRDLDAGRSGRVSAHLTECERCRALEAGLRESREWLQSVAPPPLNESDYSAVRRGVWERIEAKGNTAAERRRRAGRLVLAGGLLAGALLAVFLSVHSHSRTLQPEAQRLAASPAAVPTLEPSLLAKSSPDPSPAHAIPWAPRARARPAGPPAISSVVRIEFQTANPGVRIIWLVKEGESMPSVAASRNQEVS